jgi:hypothetical protein
VCQCDDVTRDVQEYDVKSWWKTFYDRYAQDIKYIVCALEIGEGGAVHIQGYIELNKKMEFAKLKRILRPGTHIEQRKGKPSEAAAYCKKGLQTHAEWNLDGVDGEHYGLGAKVFLEEGDLPVFSKGKRTDIETVRDAILVDKTVKSHLQLAMVVNSYQGFKFGQELLRLAPVAAMRPAPIVYWLHGSTGTGKSFETATFCDNISRNKRWTYWQSTGDMHWFDGYSAHEVAWFDDFRFEGKRGDFAFLLRLLDRYTMQVPIKGGFVVWEPKIIIITAPKSISESFHSVADLEDLGQLRRRVTREFNFNAERAGERSSGVLEFRELITRYIADAEHVGGAGDRAGEGAEAIVVSDSEDEDLDMTDLVRLAPLAREGHPGIVLASSPEDFDEIEAEEEEIPSSENSVFWQGGENDY